MAGRMLALTSSEAQTLELVLRILLNGGRPAISVSGINALQTILEQFDETARPLNKTGDRPLDA